MFNRPEERSASFSTSIIGLSLNPGEAMRLIELRKKYIGGAFSEKTDEEKRLEFARYLYQQGRISEETK
jgi:hypothetical protein